MDTKLKSKINKFHEIGENPHDFRPLVDKCFTHIHNCELCGAALHFSFILAHKDPSPKKQEKNMFIGADCVENFVEMFLPFEKDSLKRKIMALIEKTKQSSFLEENPNIKQIATEIKNYLTRDVYTYCKSNDIMGQYYSLNRSGFYKKINADLNAILRKNYLSKPKTQKVYALQKAIAEGKIEKLLTHNNKMKQQKVSDLMQVEKKFYKWFFEAVHGQASEQDKQWVLNRTAYDLFEQQDYLVDKKEKKLKMVLIKNVY